MSTTIITRLYPDAKSANAVQTALLNAGLDKRIIEVISKSGGAGAKPARERIEEAQVGGDASAAYADAVEGGNALLVVRAPFTPFGTALKAIRTVDEFPSVDVGVTNQNVYLGELPREGARDLSILPDCPLFLTRMPAPGSAPRGTVSADFGIPLLTRERPHHSAIAGGALVSRKFFPLPLLTRDRQPDSVIHGDAFMSRRFFPVPLLSPERKRNSVIPGGGTPLSTMFGWPLLIER